VALVRVEHAPTVSNVQLLAAHFLPCVLDLVLALAVFQEDRTTDVIAATYNHRRPFVILVGVERTSEVHIDAYGCESRRRLSLNLLVAEEGQDKL
jgi:hypothetical protein